MSEIKKQILLKTREIAGDLYDTGIVFLSDFIQEEWAKSIDFFNNTDGLCIVYILSEDELDNNGSGVLIPPGQNFTLEGDLEIGIFIPNVAILTFGFEYTDDTFFNVVCEVHQVIESGDLWFDRSNLGQP